MLYDQLLMYTMNKKYIEEIQDKIMELLPEEKRQERAILLEDSCSELSRLVASWMGEHDQYGRYAILKGDNVCNTTKSHDILAYIVNDKVDLIDSTIWQIFPNERSIFVGQYSNINEAISAAAKKYGGRWQKNEDLEEASPDDREEWLGIVKKNIKEGLNTSHKQKVEAKFIQIDFLKNKPDLVENVAASWCKEWSRDKSGAGLKKQNDNVLSKSNIGKIPFIIVAFDGGDFLGSAALFENDLDSMSELRPWLAGVFVKEEFRGQGIASKLVKRVLAESKKLGFHKIYLHTETASKLYQKLDCEEICETKNDNGEPTTVFVLS